MIDVGTARMPTSTRRMTGGTAKMTAATIAVKRPGSEEHEGRQQVDERRHRLGDVEQRAQERPEAVAPGGRDAQEDAHAEGERASRR